MGRIIRIRGAGETTKDMIEIEILTVRRTPCPWFHETSVPNTKTVSDQQHGTSFACTGEERDGQER